MLVLVLAAVLTVFAYLFAQSAPSGAVAGLEAFTRGLGLFNRIGSVVDGILILTRGGKPSSPTIDSKLRTAKDRIAGLAVETTTVIEEPIPMLKGAVVGRPETYPADYDPTDM